MVRGVPSWERGRRWRRSDSGLRAEMVRARSSDCTDSSRWVDGSNRIGGADRQGREDKRKRQSLPLLCWVRHSERVAFGARRTETQWDERDAGRGNGVVTDSWVAINDDGQQGGLRRFSWPSNRVAAAVECDRS